MIRFYFVLIFVLIYTSINAQPLIQQNLPFYENNTTLKLALTGGINNPQFSEVDLNNDGIQDLFIFDRTGDVPLTFINKGTANQVDYQFAPEYAVDFPHVRSWVALRDYNCDGIMDLFAHNQVPAGITVYQGYYDNNKIAYTQVVKFIDYPSFNGFPLNLFVTGEDYPAIDDIDGDGDLDILTFSVGGGWVEYYENQSQDLGFGCDSLRFKLVDNCWGRFFESGLTNSIDISPRMDSCVGRSDFIGKSADASVHVGSTLLTIDMDNDGDKEILLGDISFSTVVMGINGGTPDTAWMTSQIMDFPANTVPIDVPVFPATFSMDVNNDGKKDLLAAPNARNISENYRCSWYYENTTDNDFPVFNFKKNTFLVDEMLDFGTGTAPSFFDHNGDGLMDIVVGTFGYYESGGNYSASIFLYENTGTPSYPEYTLISTNYTNLQSGHNLRGINVTFGDLDGDGDEDMVFGEEFGKLFYYDNTDTGNGIAKFENFDILRDPNGEPIDVGQFASPYLVDIDRDGLLDMVIAELNGNLNYWRNVGTASDAVFVKTNDFFGEIDVREYGYPEGFGDVAIVEKNGEYVLYTGSEPGNIRRYTGIEASMAAGETAFFKADSLYGNIVQGSRTRLDVADINNDGEFDYIIGNRRGGLAIYSSGALTTSTITPDLPNFTFAIFPNPASNYLNIHYAHPQGQTGELTVFDVLGHNLHRQNINQNTQVNIDKLATGIYFCIIQTGGESIVRKFVKK